MLSGKRLLLLGFILLLLIATPATVYFVQKQQESRSRAEATTGLNFYSDDALTKMMTQTSPLTKNVGDIFPVNIGVDPGNNLVASIILHVKYDPTKLEVQNTDASSTTPGFARNISVFAPEPIEGPKYDSTKGEVAVWITTGTDVTTAIQAPAKPKVGTITFKALAATGSTTPTQLSFTNETQVNAWGSNATAGENVLKAELTQPGYILINGSGGTTTTNPTNTPIPTQAGGTTTTVVATATPTQSFVTATPTPVLASATPTLAATGPGDVMLGMGTLAGVVMMIGAVLFFVL